VSDRASVTTAVRPLAAAYTSPRLQPARMPQLDGVRALAVSLVVLAHAGPPAFLALGGHGVTLFFVLSAYLITGILLRLREQPIGSSLRTFYARRALRIVPAYALVLIVLVAVRAPTMREAWPWHALYLSNWWTFLNGDWAPSTAHLWTLSIEEQFYLVWPFVVLVLPERWLGPLCIASISVAVVTRAMLAHVPLPPASIVTPTPAVLDAFGIGALLAWHARHGTVSRRWLRWALGVGFVLVAHALFLETTHRGFVLLNATDRLGASLVAVWLIDRAARGQLPAAFAWRGMRYVGTISYGIYLWHLPIAWAVREWAKPDPIATEAARGSLAFFIVVSVFTLLAASVSWRWLEAPINAEKRRWPYPT
jgi:peptidoglycan/LPS O-acetylase OafA/YrhL